MDFFSAGANAAQDEQAQNAILGNVRTFADDVVQELQSFGRGMRQKEMQYRNDNADGIFRRESTGRESGNHDGPNESRPPILERAHL